MEFKCIKNLLVMHRKFQEMHGNISVIGSRIKYGDKKRWGGHKNCYEYIAVPCGDCHREKGHSIMSPTCLKVRGVERL